MFSKRFTLAFPLMALLALTPSCEEGIDAPSIPMVTITGPTLVPLGQIVSFSAVTSDGSDRAYSWSSSDPTMLHPLENGAFRAETSGEAKVTAVGLTSGAIGTVLVSLTEDPPSILAEIIGPSSLGPGQTAQYQAVTHGAYDGAYRWSSSAPSVAAIDDSGLVSALMAGQTRLMAQGLDSAAQASLLVVVGEARVIVSGPEPLFSGTTGQMVATTQHGSDPAYLWSTSDPSVAEVDASGLIKALLPGQAVISAQGSVSGASGQTTMTVTLPLSLSENAATVLIKGRCASCHTDPGPHPAGEPQRPCASCHVPFDAALAQHQSADCTSCHGTPEATHTALRDPLDPHSLLADANERCLACHQSAPSPLGRAWPALTIREKILDAAERGTLRSWIQPGGSMRKHLANEAEAALVSDWLDGREIGEPPTLEAFPLQADDDLPAAPFDQAKELAVTWEAPWPGEGTVEASVRALVSPSFLYLRITYPDATPHLAGPQAMAWDGSTWSGPSTGQLDGVAVFLNQGMPLFEARRGCAAVCHGNDQGASLFTDMPGEHLDVWRIHPALGGAYDRLEGELTLSDQGAIQGRAMVGGHGLDGSMTFYESFDGGFNAQSAGLLTDEGDGPSFSNISSDGRPLYAERSPDDLLDALVLTMAEIEAGETVGDGETGLSDLDSAAVWAAYEALGAVVPGAIQRIPSGDAGHVESMASWEDGYWTISSRRPLTTGSRADVDLAGLGEVSLSLSLFNDVDLESRPPQHTTYGAPLRLILR